MNIFKLRYRLDKFKYSNKRKSGTKSILFSILAIIVSLFIALIITCVIYQKASLFTGVIKYIFITPFTGSTYSDTISTISIFAVAAVAFLVASKAGLFNIGISGQMMFGGVVATIIAPHVVGIPDGLCQIFLLIMCVLGATFIASIIGVLKAFINVNEVVSSIMFNWIIYFVGIMLLVKFGPVTSGATVTNALATISPHLVMQMSLNGIYVAWLPLLIMAILVIAVVIVLLNYTTAGKKIINTGMSPTAAQYAGYSSKLNQIMAMLISGIIAGVLGMMVYLGKDSTMPATVAAKAIPTQGFTGISVGLIAMSNPWAVLPISTFFGMIDSSKAAFSVYLNVDPSITDMIFGIVVYGAAVISIFYFLIPYKWYLRVVKGKAYANSYDTYHSYVAKNIDTVSGLIFHLNKIERDIKLEAKIKRELNTKKNNHAAKTKLLMELKNVVQNQKDNIVNSLESFAIYNINIKECNSIQHIRAIEKKIYLKYQYFKEVDYQNFAKKIRDNQLKFKTKDDVVNATKAKQNYEAMVLKSEARIRKLVPSKEKSW